MLFRSVTGVKLEIGSVATPFNRQSLAKSMADCQRYYQTLYSGVSGYGTGGVTIYGLSTLSVIMRASPTVTFGTINYLNSSALGGSTLNANGVALQLTVTATGVAVASGPVNYYAEL